MVDFIDLANGHRQLLQRLLDGGDDDFAKMENEYSYSSSSGIRNDNSNSNSMTSQQQSYGSEGTAPAPLLSKSAEAELYLLATNFLLCTFCVFVFRFETLNSFGFWGGLAHLSLCIVFFCFPQTFPWYL